MISAGTIGGGQAPGPATPAPGQVINNNAAAPATPVASSGIGEGGLPIVSAPTNPLSAEQFIQLNKDNQTFTKGLIQDNQRWASAEGDKNRSMQYANWGFQIGSQITTAILQGYLANKEFNFRFDIADRIATKEETIAGYQKEVALKTLELLPELERERAKLTRDVEDIRESHRDRRHERSLRSRERIAATQTLDRAFGMRSDYPYGNPFAANA